MENEQKLQAEIELLEKRIRSLKNSSNDFLIKYDDLQTQIIEVDNNLQQIKNVTDNLPTSATSGDYNDLVNRPDTEFENMSNFSGYYFLINALQNSTTIDLATDKVYFLCGQDSYIEGSFTIRYRYTGAINFSTTMKVLFNEEVIAEESITIASYSTYSKTINFKVYPKQKQNYLYFVIVCTETYQAHIENVAVDITKAKNIFFLNRDYRKTVVVYKNTYYITENYNRYNTYHILNANNFNFDNPQTPAYPYGPCQYTFPEINYTTNSYIINEAVYNMLCRSYSNFGVKVSKVLTTGNISSYSFRGYGHGMTFFRQDFAPAYSPTVTGIFTDQGILGYLYGNTMINRSDYVEYKLNDQPFDYGCWVENIPVTALDMTNAPTNVFQGSVAVRTDGQCFFIPHYNSTYILPLGFGRMPSCIRQENGNIHVYLGKINCVKKIVLVFDTQISQYKIDSQQIIWAAEQYYETLDNKAITITDGIVKLIDV